MLIIKQNAFLEKAVLVHRIIKKIVHEHQNAGRIQLRSAILVVMRPSAKILQKRLNEVFYS